jgi:hypothetical protein
MKAWHCGFVSALLLGASLFSANTCVAGEGGVQCDPELHKWFRWECVTKQVQVPHQCCRDVPYCYWDPCANCYWRWDCCNCCWVKECCGGWRQGCRRECYTQMCWQTVHERILVEKCGYICKDAPCERGGGGRGAVEALPPPAAGHATSLNVEQGQADQSDTAALRRPSPQSVASSGWNSLPASFPLVPSMDSQPANSQPSTQVAAAEVQAQPRSTATTATIGTKKVPVKFAKW